MFLYSQNRRIAQDLRDPAHRVEFEILGHCVAIYGILSYPGSDGSLRALLIFLIIVARELHCQHLAFSPTPSHICPYFQATEGLLRRLQTLL